MMRGGRAAPRDALDRLAAALHHRGPDSCGIHLQGAVGLVDTRLAIVDVDGGRQPLFGPKGAVLVANGEIYNAPELRDDLGGRFATLSDCEPAVHLYERRGLDYARALRGMYAIAIHDPRDGRLVLSRDRFGIKPLYVVQTADYLAFASEPQALFAAGLASPVLEPAAEGELLQYKQSFGERTLFKGVERVAPGETLSILDGQIVERRRIETLPAPQRGPTTLEEALRRFDTVMTDSVSVHLRTDVPYGLFFSGGVDSSILLKLMQRLSQTPVQALTMGYAGQEPGDESHGALALAQVVGARCERVEMGADDFWTLAPRIAAAVDDPTADPAVLPTYMLGRAARAAGLKVTLCGEGADELFGGYTRYRRERLPWFLRKKDGERRGAFDDTPGFAGRFDGWAAGLDAAQAREAERWPTRMMRRQALDCVERLPNSLLIKLDRCLMANSVEGRTPFLDPEVAALAVSLPEALRANLRHGKVLLRHWLARNLPQARPFARKQGFNPPVGRWMAERGELGVLVAAHPLIAPLATADAVQGVFSRAAESPQPAWSLLFYALWGGHHLLGVPMDGDVADVLAQAGAA